MVLLRFWSQCFHRTCIIHSECEYIRFILHLREGSKILGVEVVERLVNLALLHVLETLISCCRHELLGFLQLDVPCTLLDLPQASSWHQKWKEMTVKALRQSDQAQSLHWGLSVMQWLTETVSTLSRDSVSAAAENKKQNERFSNSPASTLLKSSKTIRLCTGEKIIVITLNPRITAKENVTHMHTEVSYIVCGDSWTNMWPLLYADQQIRASSFACNKICVWQVMFRVIRSHALCSWAASESLCAAGAVIVRTLFRSFKAALRCYFTGFGIPLTFDH